jgi:glycosyltransferase involved in cell wall biosynthesis
MALKRMRGLPWIADLRDPWAWHDHPTYQPNSLSDRIVARMERSLVRNADRVVNVTPAVTQSYAERYPEVPGSKWMTITNGFDLEEFQGLGAVTQAQRFTISYVGGFDFQRSPILLLEAVAALIAEGKVDRDRMTVRFVGRCEYANGQPLAATIHELGLDGVAEIVPMLPRPEALRELLRSHVLLLLSGVQRLSVAAKVYEYLASGRPILAITGEGRAADIVRGAGAGRVVAPDDLQGAKDAVAHWYASYLASGSAPGPARPRLSAEALEYSWERLGRRYAEAIAAAAEPAP